MIDPPGSYVWHDAAYRARVSRQKPLSRPVNIYEVHAGSWKQHPDGSHYSYTELADELIPYCKDMEFLGYFDVPLAWRREYVGIVRLRSKKKKLRIYFIDNEHYFCRTGGIYGFTDDGERFAYFSKAVLAAMNFLELRPDVIHCNDWQTALIPLLLKTEYRSSFPNAKSVFTIHNVEYQGKANLQFNYDVLGLPAECDETLRFDDCTNFMKIVLDGVFSHVGSRSPYFQSAVSDPDSPYRPWFQFQHWPDRYTSWWGITTLPCVNKLEPGYLDFIIDGEDSVAVHWLRLGADGYRLDVADELPDAFILRLKRRIREVNPEAILIGEVWEDASNKIAYDVRRRYFTDRELDSVMDGGTQSWAWSPERLNANLAAIGRTLAAQEADFYTLQEVDLNSTRTYHTDEKAAMLSALGAEDSVYALNFDSPFLLYPLRQPHGKSVSGILTATRFEITSSVRRSLPVEKSLKKLVDLDRCYTVTRIPVENGRELCLYNIHLSAYTTDGTIADEQLELLITDMVFNGSVVNQPTTNGRIGERKVSDIVYIG